MDRTSEVVANAVTGERFVFEPRTGEDVLAFEMHVTSGGGIPEQHLHLHQSEVFRCVSGRLRVLVRGEERELREGEELRLAAGTPHAFTNPYPEPCVCEVEYRPAGLNEPWLRLIAAYATKHGALPGALDLAPFIGDVDIYLAGIPLSVQRALFAVLRVVAVSLGRRESMLALAREAFGEAFSWPLR